MAPAAARLMMKNSETARRVMPSPCVLMSQVVRWVLVWLLSYGVGGRAWQPAVPALILFGDSTVDVGNNDFLPTLAKSDFPPYGREFDAMTPTGRFTDGKMVGDFLAIRLGLPMSLPYLDPNANGQNLVHGINFASAASGYLNTTSASLNVLPASEQLQLFEEYKVKLAGVIGPQKAAWTISEALYFISTGSNDYILNYFVNPPLQRRYSTDHFNALLLSTQTQFLQNLHKAGARKMGILGFPPLGCIPAQITIFGAPGQQTCVEEQNAVALAYNKQLQSAIPRWQASLPGSQLLYLDAYSQLYDMFNNPSKYGFVQTRRACCGHGFLSTVEFCNTKTEGTCADASKFVFFDSLHPTQTVYKRIAEDYEQKLFSFFKLGGEY